MRLQEEAAEAEAERMPLAVVAAPISAAAAEHISAVVAAPRISAVVAVHRILAVHLILARPLILAARPTSPLHLTSAAAGASSARLTTAARTLSADLRYRISPGGRVTTVSTRLPSITCRTGPSATPLR